MTFRTEADGLWKLGIAGRATIATTLGYQVERAFFVEEVNGEAIRAYLEHEIVEWEAIDEIGTRHYDHVES